LTGLLVFGDAAGQSTLDVGTGRSLGDFTLAADGSGTLVTTDVPCFVAGTLIRGACGDVPVEALRPGDLVRTLGGRLAPVVWVGRRRIDLSRHPRPWRVAPLRILAGALAPGVPARDLWVSPDHALYLDRRLVPAGRLANGATIARQDGLASVAYVHVELDRHDLVFAEGCVAESYLDTGNRRLFANGAGPLAMHPDLAGEPDAAACATWAECAAAPLLLRGKALAVLRARLLARATTLGWARTTAARPALRADGKVPPLREVGEGAWRARLHPSAKLLRVASDSFIPTELWPDSGDPRRLGLAVRALLLDGVPLPDSAFGAGWHAAEAAWRWSDGCGEIRLPPRLRTATLDVLTAPAGDYWRPPRRPPGGCSLRQSKQGSL
jgi:hypothetical protein